MFLSENLTQVATGRKNSFFAEDFENNQKLMRDFYRGKSVLVIGGAGTIGAACIREILAFNPARLDIVDINENGLANLARTIRSDRSLVQETNISFNTLDFGSAAMQLLVDLIAPWDTVLNFAAVKHVRSEKNLPCILHMLNVNVCKQAFCFDLIAKAHKQLDYFVISTDKAANPANLMGASKKLLELAVFTNSEKWPSCTTSSARFANVAFSAGSLLESFVDRFRSNVPLACPDKTQRYFISPREAAQICLLGQAAKRDKTVVVPRMNADENLTELSVVAEKFLQSMGFEPIFVTTENEGFGRMKAAVERKQWPVILTPRDTAGEKEFEIFAGSNDKLEEIGYKSIQGVRFNCPSQSKMEPWLQWLDDVVNGKQQPSLESIDAEISKLIPEYVHITGKKLLDDRI